MKVGSATRSGDAGDKPSEGICVYDVLSAGMHEKFLIWETKFMFMRVHQTPAQHIVMDLSFISAVYLSWSSYHSFFFFFLNKASY